MKGTAPLRLAIKNVRRSSARSIMLILSSALVSGSLYTGTLLLYGMHLAVSSGLQRLGADVLVVPRQNPGNMKSALLSGEPTTFYMKSDLLDRIRGVAGVLKASPQLFVKPTPFSCCYNVDAFIVAFDPDSDFTVTPWLKRRLLKPLGADEIIVGGSMPVSPGDTIPFFGTPLSVMGAMEPTGIKYFDQSVYMTFDTAWSMADNSVKRAGEPLRIDRQSISAVLVRTKDSEKPELVAIRIEHESPDVSAIPSGEAFTAVKRQLRGLIKGIGISGGMLWMMAILMTASAFYSIVNERRREIGILRAMGAGKKDIARIIVLEAVTVSFSGGVTGVCIGHLSLSLFRQQMISMLQLQYLSPPADVIALSISGAIAITVTGGVIASLLPAIKAAALEPFSALRSSE